MAFQEIFPKDSRHHGVVSNLPTGRSTLGSYEGPLGDNLTLVSLLQVDCFVDITIVPY